MYLETGTGKTRIAALLIKHFLNTVDELARPDDESQTAENAKNVIFLVPTAILVAQQAVQVDDVVNGKQKAGMYNGEKGVDAWDSARWAKEFQCAARQLTLMPHCLLACLPACLLACLPACLLACLPACLLACVQPKSCALRRMHCCSADFINFDCAAFCFPSTCTSCHGAVRAFCRQNAVTWYWLQGASGDCHDASGACGLPAATRRRNGKHRAAHL